MKSNYCKAIILLFLIMLTEGFEIQKKGKLNMRKKMLSSAKVRYNKLRKGRYGSHHRNKEEVCKIGFGFEGYTLEEKIRQAFKCVFDAVKLSNLSFGPTQLKKDIDETFTQIFDWILNQFATQLFNVAIGDFTGSRINKDLTNFTCQNLGVADDQKVGIFAIFAGYLPCPLPTEVKICVMFDQCGTFGLSFNGGIASCILKLMGPVTAGLSLSIARIVKIVETAAFSFSFHQKLAKKVRIVEIVPETETEPADFKDSEVTIKGNILTSLNLSLPLPKMKIDGKTLDDYFGFSSSANTIMSFGKLGNIITNTIENIKTGQSLDPFIETLRRVGIEVAVSLSEKFKLKLNKLSRGFLPDIDLTLPSFTFFFTSGCASSGLSPGIYFKININLGDYIRTVILQILGPFNAILKLLGFDTNQINFSDLNYFFSLVMNTQFLGFAFESSLVTFKCLYGIETSKGGCEVQTDGLKKLFTVLYDTLKWLLIEAEKFFQELGNIIGVISEGNWGVIDRTRLVIKNFLLKLGKAIQDLGDLLSDKAIQVKDALVSASKTAYNWFTSWRRRRLRRMMRMRKLRKMRKLKKMRKYH